MSPVCKKCRNYVMSFPCPHCGSDQAFTDRAPNEIKPIIPLDLQGSFQEPPPPLSTSPPSTIPSFQTSVFPKAESPSPPKQTPPSPRLSSSPPSTPPPHVPSSVSTIESSPSVQPPIKKSTRPPPPPRASQETNQVPTLSSHILSSSKDYSETAIPTDDINKSFNYFKSRLKEIDSRQKKYESKVKEFESYFKEIDNRLKKVEKSLTILLKTNQKLESIHKNASKDLKKTL